MAEEIIDDNTPQDGTQQPTSYTKSVYDGLADKFGAKNMLPFDEFSKKISTDKNFAKNTHDALIENYGEKNVEDFNSFYDKVKKNASSTIPTQSTSLVSKSISQSEGSNEQPTDESPIDVLGLSKQADELSKATKTINSNVPSSAGYMAQVQQVPDDEKVAQSQQIKQQLKDKGYDADEINKSFSGLPKELLDDPTSQYSKDKLLKLYKDNKTAFDQTIASAKWQTSLVQSIVDGVNRGDKRFQGAMDEWRDLRNEQSIPKQDYESTRKHAQQATALIYKYIDDPDEQKKALDNLATDSAISYGVGVKGTKEALEKDPNSKYLNNNELLGYQYLQDTNPQEASTFNNVLIDKNKLPQVEKTDFNTGETTTETDKTSLIGLQQQKAKLAELGASLQMKAASKKIDELKSKAASGTPLTEDETNAYNGYIKQYNDAQSAIKETTNVDSKDYGEYAKQKLSDVAQELLGQKHGYLANQGLEFMSGMGNTISSAVNGISDLFKSDDEIKASNLQNIGNNIRNRAETYQTEINGAKVSLTPDLIYKVHQIKNDPNLTDDEKLNEGIKMLSKNKDDWDVEYGEAKTTPKSIAYKLSNTLNGLGQFVLTAAGTSAAGIPQKLNAFVSTVLMGYNKDVSDNIENNVPNPYGKALASNLISGVLFQSIDKIGALKKMFTPESAIGKAVNNLSNDELKGIIAKSNDKNLLDNIISAAGTSFKNTLPMTGAQVGSSIAHDAVNGDLKKADDYIKEGLENQAIFTLLGLPMGILNKYSENKDNSKEAQQQLSKNIVQALKEKAANRTNEETNIQQSPKVTEPIEEEINQPIGKAKETKREGKESIVPEHNNIETNPNYRTAYAGNHEGEQEFTHFILNGKKYPIDGNEELLKNNPDAKLDKSKESQTETKKQQTENIKKFNVPLDEGTRNPKGETMQDFVGRVVSQYEKDKSQQPDNSVIVTHSSVLKALKTYEAIKKRNKRNKQYRFKVNKIRKL